MTEHPFATLLRKLDAEASKAPWHTGSETTRISGYNFALVRPSHRPGEQSVALVPSEGFDCPNARAIVTLRNAAPEVAALVEAADALRLFFADNDGAPPNMDSRAARDRLEAFNAALDALARAARDATSGPADPTRIEGGPK